jgi:hypothetical protein
VPGAGHWVHGDNWGGQVRGFGVLARWWGVLEKEEGEVWLVLSGTEVMECAIDAAFYTLSYSMMATNISIVRTSFFAFWDSNVCISVTPIVAPVLK